MWYEFRETKTYKPNNLPLVNLTDVYNTEVRYELKPGDVLTDGNENYLIGLFDYKATLIGLKDGQRKSGYVLLEKTDSLSQDELNKLTDYKSYNFIVKEPTGRNSSLISYVSTDNGYSPVQVGERLYSINGIERYIVGGMANETSLHSEYLKFILNATTGEVIKTVANVESSTDRNLSKKEAEYLLDNLGDYYVLRGSHDDIKL